MMRLIRFFFIGYCLTLVFANKVIAEIRTLPPMINTELTQKIETRQLIVKAEAAIKEFRLNKPYQNNALFYIESLLSQAPKNSRIHLLVIEVVQTYKKIAFKKTSKQQNESALVHYKKALKVANKYNLTAELKELSSLIETIQQDILATSQLTKIPPAPSKNKQRPIPVKKQPSPQIDKTLAHSHDLKKKFKATASNLETKLSNVLDAEPEMVAIPVEKGKFTIGTAVLETRHESNEKQNRIPIPVAYALSRYEVTVGEFRKFVQATQYSKQKNQPNSLESHTTWDSPGFKQSDNNPVVNVSWNDAITYIHWLNQEHPEQNYRLPTEAEWEYAARGNTDTTRYWGNNSEIACRYANVYDQTLFKIIKTSHSIKCNDHYAYTAPVNDKQFIPNAFGLYHILGNVREWTCSSYKPLYQGQEQQCAELNSKSLRVLRGGSWADKARHIRSGDRDVDSPETFNNKTGFRLARTL